MCCRMCDAGIEYRFYAVYINGGIKSIINITDG